MVVGVTRFYTPPPPPDPFPPAELPEEGLARPVVAGVVATICFLAAAVLFSTLAACFVNKQHRRKLKRKPGQSLSSSLSGPGGGGGGDPAEETLSVCHFCVCVCVCPGRSSPVRDALQEKHRVTVSQRRSR